MNRIEEIRAREQAAIRGKWSINLDKTTEYMAIQRSGTPICAMSMLNSIEINNSNAAFIAHARQDIPYLLLEVDRLTAELEQYRKQETEYSWYGEGMLDCDMWEEPISICILQCEKCGWTFYGDCFTRNSPGFDYKGEQVPNYCPHCGRKISEEAAKPESYQEK